MSITVTSNEKTNQSVPAQNAELDNNNSLDENLSEEIEASENDSENLESDDDGLSEESEANKSKKKGGFQKKIDKLTARAKTAEQRALAAEAALLAKQSNNQADKEQSKTETTQIGKPNPDNFNTYAEYTEALTDWIIEQREAKAKANDQEKQAKTEAQKRAETFQSKINEFKKEHTDFEDVIDDCEVDLSKDLQSMILESDLAPQLMYDLASKPEEIERLNGLKGTQLAKALGVLEDRLSKNSESKKAKQTTTKAPAPISPVGAKGGTAHAKSLSDPNLSFTEYERIRKQQLNSKR